MTKVIKDRKVLPVRKVRLAPKVYKGAKVLRVQLARKEQQDHKA